MKKLAVLAAVVCAFAAMGQDSMSTDLTTSESAKAWMLDGKPENFPALKFGFDAEKSAFAVENNDPKVSVYFKCPKLRLAAQKGDVIHVTFEACGKGKMFLTYECFSDSQWTGMGTRSKFFQLTEEWTKFEDDLIVKDCKDLATVKIMLDFCVRASGSMWIRSFTAVNTTK